MSYLWWKYDWRRDYTKCPTCEVLTRTPHTPEICRSVLVDGNFGGKKYDVKSPNEPVILFNLKRNGVNGANGHQ